MRERQPLTKDELEAVQSAAENFDKGSGQYGYTGPMTELYLVVTRALDAYRNGRFHEPLWG